VAGERSKHLKTLVRMRDWKEERLKSGERVTPRNLPYLLAEISALGYAIDTIEEERDVDPRAPWNREPGDE